VINQGGGAVPQEEEKRKNLLEVEEWGDGQLLVEVEVGGKDGGGLEECKGERLGVSRAPSNGVGKWV